MRIEILGPGCSRCQTLAQRAEAVARKLGVEYELIKVLEIDEIVKRGVMMTPALVVDGRVRSVGRIPGEEEIESYLRTDK